MSSTYSDVELSDQAPGSESDISVGGSTTQTSLEPSRSSEHYGGVSRSSKPSVRSPVRSGDLPDFSDDPNDDTDEDIVNVPLDYRRSEKTKIRGALRQVTPNNVHRFLNYCLKLKYGQDGRHLKGTNKASSLKADWKSFCGYFRRITHTRISPEDREEINAGIRKLIDKWELDHQERGKEPVYIRAYSNVSLQHDWHLHRESTECPTLVITQKDPQGGPPVLLAEIRSEHIKRFLGSEAIYV
ncbi:hypothetical protein N7486_004044 [Penicillium sp. IBT 16267x]|nr:hypothetical protein N7486_004044 [Penicillium sp. IBT 16267x]